MTLDQTQPRATTARRRRGALVLVLLGLASLTAGILLSLFLWLDTISYRYWPADAELTEGEAGHEVAVEPGERFLLWKELSLESPACTAVALPSGEPVPLIPTSSGSRGGGAVPWVGFAEGRTDSSRVSVSCAAPPRTAYGPEPAVLYVDQADGPLFLDGFGPWWPAAVALLGAGVVLPAAGFARARRR